MTTPDWTDVTPQPIGYMPAADLADVSRRRMVGTVMRAEPEPGCDVPVYGVLMARTEAPGPQEYMRGYSDGKAWAASLFDRMPRADVAPLLECGLDGPQCLIAEQWAQDYAKTYTRTKLDKLAQRIDQRGWEEEAELMRAAARDTDQALTLLAMLHGRVCHMMAHLGMVGEIDTRHAAVDALGDALDDVNEFVARVLAPPTWTITPQSMRQAVAQCEVELGGDWCETCPTVDACRIRGACSPFLGKPRAP